MWQFPNEFVTAILISSTAFAGLTAPMMGRIVDNKHLDKKQRNGLGKLLGASLGLGITAIGLVIIRFITGYDGLLGVAAIALWTQLLVFFFVVRDLSNI